jgi:hypothetical protein
MCGEKHDGEAIEVVYTIANAEAWKIEKCLRIESIETITTAQQLRDLTMRMRSTVLLGRFART